MTVPADRPPPTTTATTPAAAAAARLGLLGRLRRRLPDDWAYLLPMLTFLAAISLAGQSSPYYPLAYAGRAVLVAGLLVWFWPAYTRIKWDYWWLGLLLGVVGIAQWVGMQLWLQGATTFFAPPAADQLYNPFEKLQPAWVAWAFVAVRMAGAVLVVPVMEELFWRDYLWRRIVAPNDFKLAKVGEWDPLAYLGVSAAFAVVHGNWWLTAVVWGLMVGGLLLYTRSLGACIVMHAMTNLLLAIYVLWTGDWSFW